MSLLLITNHQESIDSEIDLMPSEIKKNDCEQKLKQNPISTSNINKTETKEKESNGQPLTYNKYRKNEQIMMSLFARKNKIQNWIDIKL